MRVGIREQLAAVVLLTALIPLVVLAVVTWVNNRNFVVNVTSQELTLTASLKAAQIASDLLLIQATCATIVTRVLLQQAIKSFYKGNLTDANWNAALNDVSGALASGGYSSLLQTIVFSRNETGSSPNGLIRATALTSGIQLPGTYPNGTNITLGDPSNLGYPTALYPNITYATTDQPDPMDLAVNATLATAFADYPLNNTAALLLGPLQINDTYALLSLTLPIVDNSNGSIVLGYMTVVAAASSLISVTRSQEGLAQTGLVLLVGPSRRENQFKYSQRPATATYLPPKGDLDSALVHYIFPPKPLSSSQTDRHTQYNSNITQFQSSNFTMSQYPAVVVGFGKQNSAINNASSILTTINENNVSVAVGYARPQSTLVSWLLIIEQSHQEAWEPIFKLRNIVLACVFGAIGLILLVVLPMAHFSVRPIARLRDATKNSIAPPGYSTNGSIHSETLEDGELSGDDMGDLENRTSGTSHRSKKGFFVRLRNLGTKRKTKVERTEAERRRVFKIPAKVQDRKHFIKDELTELTQTFNSMSDELMLQYQSLEDKVADRTRELEISKKSAEAANQSKTLFIANISHELKTPLNGILGMCALCMGETDLAKIQRSLQIAYKSGDLLLHLLNDLLTFSKNQIGQQLALDESEFRLIDIKTQLNTIFMKQVQDGKVNFSVRFLGTDGDPETTTGEKTLPALGPHGTGRLKDMCLYGDVHRILQIIINLVGNSLKFTPPGGKVEVRIKCLGEAEVSSEGSRNSMGSKQSSSRSPRHRHDSHSNHSQLSRNASNPQKPLVGTALAINPMEPKSAPRIQLRERSPASHPQPIPQHSCTLVFQIEVEDTGPGIPVDFRERVFEPFVQGDLGLSRKHGGTGLGLSICSQLASLMGGNIALVRSEEGVGSTFALTIPLRYIKSRTPSTSSSDAHTSRPQSAHDRPESARTSSQRDSGSRTNFDKDPQPRLVGLSQPFFAAPPTPSPGKEVTEKQGTFENSPEKEDTTSKLRVLVAEDNLVNQEVVTRMLKLEDIYDVVIAKDGQEAFDMVKENMSKGQYFDLIFMDIQMPNLDGLQSTRLIRQMGYSAPIVALTAFAEESNVKECHEAGMDMFLSKPIRRPALKQVLKKFATIPEEPEISSLKTGKSSSGKSEPEPSAAQSSTDPKPSKANGTAIP